MTRVSKQGERRAIAKRRPRPPAPKTGPKKDNLELGYKPHANALEGDLAKQAFIPKVG